MQPIAIAVILDNIRSLYNVGSIFRTADGSGVEKIYLAGITPSPLDRFKKVRPQIKKVALGAETTVAWEKISRSAAIIKKLKNENYAVYAVEQSNRAVPYYKIKPAAGGKILLIFGGEIKGLSDDILNLVDEIIEIPMSGRTVNQFDHPKNIAKRAAAPAVKKESLNVAVAFGIIAYHFQHAPA